MTILEKLKEHTTSHPNKKAIISDSSSFTFHEIDGYSDYIADYVISNSTCNIIPMYIHNTLYIVPVVIGILKSGKIPIPLTTDLQLEHALERIADVDFDLVVLDSDLRYFTIFSYRKNIYAVIHGNLFKKNKYIFPVKIVIEKY